MYASAYAFAKKLDRELLVDDETAYKGKRNIYKYYLDIFNFHSKKAPVNLKFLGMSGYLRRKALKYLDKFRKIKNFYIEPKDINKNTLFNKDALIGDFKNFLYVEGHFETEKYFNNYSNEIREEYTFKNTDSLKNNAFYKDIKNSNSVCICVRQNRFSERKRDITKKDDENSLNFTKEQINYIKRAVDIIKTKVSNPKFFLWSNDYKNLNNYFLKNEHVIVSTNKIASDLFLMTQVKHFVVIPSSYNWWGAWLGENKNKIVLRPSDNHFSNFRLNNRDFWPKSWIEV
jgi:hypothetical protein